VAQVKRRVLIVVDMQNDFVAEDGVLSFPAAREALPFIKEKVKAALEQGCEVVFTLDTHEPGDQEFTKFSPHCLEGTWGHELVPDLKLLADGAPDKVLLLKKSRYSAFFGTELEEYLGLTPGARRPRVDEVELVGVCTNICCFFTAEELANRDVPVRVYAQGMASFDRAAHDFALRQMCEVLGVSVE
jgi:nicotinamidase/pyrazinamidase